MTIAFDGPIYHISCYGTIIKGSDHGIEEALQIMNMVLDEECKYSDAFSTISIKFLNCVKKSQINDRERLSAFREYRNILSNLMKKAEFIADDQRLVIGIYRLILEMAFSAKTSSALKKSACSCITLIEKMANHEEIHLVNESVIYTLVFEEVWFDPVQSLFDVMSYQPTLGLIQRNPLFITGILTKLSNQSEHIKGVISDYSCLLNTNTCDIRIISSGVGQAIDQGVSICSTLRLFLNSFDLKETPFRDQLDHIFSNAETRSILYDVLQSLMQNLIVPIISCTVTSSDSLSVSSVVMGYILLWSSQMNELDHFDIANKSYEFIQGLSYGLRELNQVALYRGLVSTLPDQALLHTLDSTAQVLLIELASFLLRVTGQSTDNSTRLSAMKGLDTIMARLLSLVPKQHAGVAFVDAVRKLSEDILYNLISSWESPPSKQIESSIPALFSNLVSLLEELDRIQRKDESLNSIDVLVQTILSQPTSRKGRYVALEILLPKVGATRLFQLSRGSDMNENYLVSSFFKEIGRRGNTAGAVAELLAKLLNRLRIEMKLDSFTKTRSSDCYELSRDWCNVWLHPLALALLNGNWVHKSSISSFWLPQIPVAVGGASCKVEAAYAFSVLLETVNELGKQLRDKSSMMWAGIEICRHADMLRLLKVDIRSPLRAVVKSSFSEESLFDASTHESSVLRISAFQTVGPILMSYDEYFSDPYKCVQSEIQLWKRALPYAFKCSEKEYLSSLSNALFLFLIHISEVEMSILGDKFQNCPSELLVPFANYYLIDNIFVNQAAYPGTVSEKEKFALILMDTIVSFSTQNITSSRSKNVPRNPSETVKPIQEIWKMQILMHMLHEHVMSTIFSLIHSQWDSTRYSVYRLISFILYHGTTRLEQNLPRFLTESYNGRLMEARALHLASSPRQRESDAGARLLTLLWYCRENESERASYLSFVFSKLKDRVLMMESALGLSDSFNYDAEKPLPLAHGLIQTFTLILGDSVISAEIAKPKAWLHHELLQTCIRAIEVSLIVVADIKDDELTIDSMENWKRLRSSNSTNIPLNVNTGAIGANGGFTNLNNVDDTEMERRLTIQRVVVGNWLLIKEASLLIPEIIISKAECSNETVNAVGNLLISCLTTLKHQGGAFAAHKALEKICHNCYSSKAAESNRILPTTWAKRFLSEISGSNSAVRDSTLRRSTGYGLGFLAILRSELTSPRVLFSFVLTNVIKLSLPPASAMFNYMALWKSTPDKIFSYHRNLSDDEIFIPDNKYDIRSRVHALNVLRLIILDAPLSESMREYAGDSIISALIGYKDVSWNVRNSSTMTYSAAMLRVVDADKNADMSRDSEGKPAGNAITCKELFRSYPPLLNILPELIKNESSESCSNDFLHPALFPLFLLLARLQPLTLQPVQIEDITVSEALIDPIIRSLGHMHHKVRMVASRALAVLCLSEHSNEMSSRSYILRKCLSLSTKADTANHNLHHGVLLAIKILLATAPDRESHCSEDILAFISHFASWSDFTCESHPYCTATALEIQYDLYVHSKKMDRLKIALHETASKIIRLIEYLTTQGMDLVGMSTLSRVASSIVSVISFDVVFDRSAPYQRQMKFALSFQSCVNGKNHDVIVQTVKSFKKGICKAVDSFGDGIAGMSDIKTLKLIANICLKTTIKLLRRKSTPHPPTLRRLTKIALECIYSYKRLNGLPFFFNNFLDIPSDQIWSTIESLLVIGGFSIDNKTEKNEALGSGNGLACNAVELFALYIADFVCCDSEQLPNCLESNMDKVCKYADIIRQSSHPLAHWTVRYSAALGTFHSRILRHRNRGGTFEPLRLQVLFYLFKLLQDSDEDVRRQVGKTLSNSENGMEYTSLLRLEQVTIEFSEQENTPHMLAVLSKHLLSLCENVLIQVATITKEYNFTARCEDSLNIDTNREIFEEEDPNPYEEVLVIIHSTIIRLCNISDNRLNLNAEAMNNLIEIQFKCSETLSVLYQSFLLTGESDFSHNMSFVGSLFPLIHGLILGASYSLWVGLDDLFELLKLSNSILSMEHACLHPSLVNALEIMSRVNVGDAISQQSIKQCCFLLPFTT